MKNILAIVLIALSTLAASAQETTSMLDPKYIQTLPNVRVLSVLVDSGPRLAAVQPTAHLNFEYASCATQDLSLKVQEQDGLLIVAVELKPDAIDCMGMPRARTYSLQISSDFRHRVIVINPQTNIWK